MFAKKSYICLLVSIFFAVISCSDDDTNPGNTGQESIDPNPAEEVSLDPSVVSNNITIENASIVNGNPPAPSGGLAFSMNYSTQSGFQKNGVNITFDAPDNYAGAYIQIISSDGTPAANYWDVAGFQDKTPEISPIANRKRVFTNSRVITSEQEIDVDFEDTVSPGKFCYLICIYDTNGNISEPQEVCVEVEAWGGNPNLVGTWNYTKQVSNGQTTLPGEVNDCYEEIIFCNNSEEITYESCYTLDAFKLTINSDGTYQYRSDSTDTELNYEASAESCTVIFDEDEVGYYISMGNWAYDEEEGKMTLIEFTYTEAYGDEIYNGTEENGYLDIDALVDVNGSSLIVTAIDNEEDTPRTVKFHFAKE